MICASVRSFNSASHYKSVFYNVKGENPPEVAISWANHLPSIADITRPQWRLVGVTRWLRVRVVS